MSEMSRTGALLEVIVCSISDAIEAQRGGAGRLEIVSDLARGGMTPPPGLVKGIVTLVPLPVRVMLRESASYEIASEAERERLCHSAFEFSSLRIDGFVLGFLRSGTVDVKLTQQILDCAPGLKATFHHAFEETEPCKAIREIKKIRQIDRILTHAGTGDWPEKCERLAGYQHEARPEIEMIAGGGLDAESIKTVNRLTEIREFHVGRAARAAASVDAPVQAARVKTLVDAVKERKDGDESELGSEN
jgi:copper homeostasis protein